MKINEYISNPLGKRNSSYPAKQIYLKFKQKYETIEDKISLKIHSVRGNLYLHFMIPSTVDGIFYDTVLSFIPTEGSAGASVMDMDFKVFSNCPSFVFTYAYAYNKRGIVITDIQKRLTKQAIVQSADTTNPYNIPGYEYSVIMAIIYLITHKITGLEYLHKHASFSLTIGSLVRSIQDFDSLMLRRTAREKQLSEKKKEDTHKIKKPKGTTKTITSDMKNDDSIFESSKVSKTGVVGRIGKVKNISKIKKK